MYSLTRNIGSSIGISIMMALLARHTQAYHSILGEFLNPFRHGIAIPPNWSGDTIAGAVAANAELTRQASSIAYLDDFAMMMWVVMAAMPLLVLMQRPRPVLA